MQRMDKYNKDQCLLYVEKGHLKCIHLGGKKISRRSGENLCHHLRLKMRRFNRDELFPPRWMWFTSRCLKKISLLGKRGRGRWRRSPWSCLGCRAGMFLSLIECCDTFWLLCFFPFYFPTATENPEDDKNMLQHSGRYYKDMYDI